MSTSRSSKSDRAAAPTSKKRAAPTPEEKAREEQGWRETLESFIIAIILAFMFRSHEAEAFVIPTGSMAPTLMGQHVDVRCPQCGVMHQANASHESGANRVVNCVCPVCRFPRELNANDANERSFTGDRILVNKFAYELAEPERWSVIVFKYPGNAKQNYIKRLVGRPNETVRVRHGDIWIRDDRPGAANASAEFRIARKPPHKLVAMLQLVDDTRHVPKDLKAAGWPDRWQPFPDGDSASGAAWGAGPAGGYTLAAAPEAAWLRYRHIAPSDMDWELLERWTRFERFDDPTEADDYVHWLGIRKGAAQQDEYNISIVRQFDANSDGRLDPVEKTAALKARRRGEWISDFNAYNTSRYGGQTTPSADSGEADLLGMHWVGDLAVEANVRVKSASGELLLDLVEAGAHFTCRVDVATGRATLACSDGRPFVDDAGQPQPPPEAQTKLRGPGAFRLRLSNCDNQLLLWVNDRVVAFSGPTSYRAGGLERPVWSPGDPGDLAPAGIGGKGLELEVEYLRVLRDIYYTAVNGGPGDREGHDYQLDAGWLQESALVDEYVGSAEAVRRLMRSPERWADSKLFAARRQVEFQLGPDQFFPMGDNTTHSQDARLWTREVGAHYVERRYLIGEAILVYWPHGWAATAGAPDMSRMLPNFRRMRLIR